MIPAGETERSGRITVDKPWLQIFGGLSVGFGLGFVVPKFTQKILQNQEEVVKKDDNEDESDEWEDTSDEESDEGEEYLDNGDTDGCAEAHEDGD